VGTSITDDSSDFVAVLLGLSDVKILQIQQGSGGLRSTIETLNDLAGCRGCGVVAIGHGRDVRTLRDVPISGRPVELVWRKRVWICKESNCPVLTWSEQHEQMPPDELLTLRAGLWALRQVGQEKRPVASVARELAVAWGTVMNAVKKHGEPSIKQQQEQAQSPTAIGVDEHAWQHQNATRPTGYVTGIMDTSTSPAKLLDVVQGRSGAVLGGWLTKQPQQWREGIQTAALAPFRGYANALSEHLTEATQVLDAFHVTKLANKEITDVRCRVQQEQLGHRGRKGDPLYRIRRTLLKNPAKLTPRQKLRLNTAFTLGDPNGEVKKAWEAAHHLAHTYRAPHREERIAAALWALGNLHKNEVPEVAKLGRTLRAWRTPFLAYHDTGGTSNGPTEATNLIIEKNRRVAHGYRNFKNYRLRLLLESGITWAPRPALPIRTRKPSLVA
jgi:transposase